MQNMVSCCSRAYNVSLLHTGQVSSMPVCRITWIIKFYPISRTILPIRSRIHSVRVERRDRQSSSLIVLLVHILRMDLFSLTSNHLLYRRFQNIVSKIQCGRGGNDSSKCAQCPNTGVNCSLNVFATLFH